MAARDGDDRNNVLIGTGGDDVLRAFGGDDVLLGLDGNDTLEGGSGIDTLDGGPGNDILRAGGFGEEVLIGGPGDDLIVGSDVESYPSGRAFINASFADTRFSVSVGSLPEPSIHLSSVDGEDELGRVATIQFNDRLVVATLVLDVSRLYQKYVAREPTQSEYHYWLVRTAGELETALRRDPAILGIARDKIIDSYDLHAGRPPSEQEIGTWLNFYATNTYYSYDSLSYQIGNQLRVDNEAQPFFMEQITSFYQDYMGRSPRQQELNAWKSAIFQSAQYDYARAYIISSAEAQAYLNPRIDAAYNRYLGVSPTAQEHGNWMGALYGGATLATLDAALISQGSAASGVASRTGAAGADLFTFDSGFTSAVVRNFDVAQDDLSLSGTPFAAVNVRDPARVAQIDSVDIPGTQDVVVTLDETHKIVLKGTDREQYLDRSVTTVDDLYRQYFGRATVGTEKLVWDDQFADGYTFDSLRAELLSSRESAATGVSRVPTTAGADTIAYGPASGDIVVAGFDPARDTISLRGTAYAGTDPLAAGLAHDVTTIHGGQAVLVEFGPDNVILLQNLMASQLSSGDFLF